MTSSAPSVSAVPMSFGGHMRAVTALGLPLMIGHLGQSAIQLTDTIMLGWYSVGALAAAVLSATLFYTLFTIGAGVAWAVLPLVAEAAARDDQQRIRRVTRMGLWLSTGFGVLMLPFLIWSEPILLALGQPPQVAADAQDYLRIAGWGMFPALGVMVLKSYVAALERAQVVLWVTIAAAVVNGVVNYLLIFGHFGFPEMGLAGAAIASVTVHVLSLILLALYAVWTRPQDALFQRVWRPDPATLREVFRLGWPIGLTNLSESGLFSATAIMMGWLGTIPLAAHGIAIQVTSATFMFHMGLSNAATVRAGRALGRNDLSGLALGGWAALAVSLIFAVLTMALFLSVPGPLIGAFVDPDEPARATIIATGIGLLAMAALFQLADGVQVTVLGLLRGVQDTRVPMWLAAVSYWVVGMPVSYGVGIVAGWDGIGIWIGLITGLSVAAALLMARFWWHSMPRLRGGWQGPF